MQERYVLKQVGYMKLEEIDYACCANPFSSIARKPKTVVSRRIVSIGAQPSQPGSCSGQTPAHNRATWLLQDLVVLGLFSSNLIASNSCN